MKTIKCNKKYETLVRELSGDSDRKEAKAFDNIETRIFPNRYDLMIFAVGLGYNLNKKESNKDKNIETWDMVPSATLSRNEILIHQLNLIAVAESKRVEILDKKENVVVQNEDSIQDIVENFLNGGLKQISEWCSGINAYHISIMNGLKSLDIIKNFNVETDDNQIEDEDINFE